ncbi:MAG: toxin TcdB middle/N-terminal domain-containing protein, partial [Candidatus Omnitrophota bacterium]
DDYPSSAGSGRIEEIKLFYQKQLFKTYSLVYEYSLATGRSLLKEIQEWYPDKNLQRNPAGVRFSYNEARPVYETIVNENLPNGDKLWNVCAAQAQKPSVKEDDSWWLGPTGFRIYYNVMGGRIDPVDWSQTYVQNQGEASGLSWVIEPNGNIKIKGKKGYAFHLWTYVTAKGGKALTFSPIENCNAKIFNAGEYDSMWGSVNKRIPDDPPNKIYIDKGLFTRIDITGYNFDDDFSFDLGLGLAGQMEVMNSQEAFIPQLSGDFNGDGVSDLGTFYKETGKCEVILSVVNGYSTKEVWIENFGKKSEVILGDFNGDGKTDLCSFSLEAYPNREWRVALSDGSKFIDQGVWLNAYLPGRIVTADFNGDGRTDICSTWTWSGDHYRAALSTGKGFSLQEEVTTSSIGTNYSCLGDYNGDGITDFGLLSIADSLKVEIEGYKGIWRRTVDSGKMQLEMTDPQFTADIDSDGRASFCHFFQLEGGGGYFYIFDHYNIENVCNISGKNAIYSCKYKFPGWLDAATNINSGDFNGDGLADFIVYDLAGHREMALSASNFSDVLTSVDNGWGGRIELEYKPSAFYENTTGENKSGLPFSMPVVSKTRVFDRVDSFQETIYSYSQGYYDLKTKEFRGFGYTSSRDEDGNTNETYFLQDDIYKGKLSRQKIIDAAGKVISEVKNTWKNTSVYPGVYIISLGESSQFINDGGCSNERKTNFEYDVYGNRTKQKESGDLNVSGDERETIIEYAYNKLDWLISYPRHIFVQDANGKKVSEKRLYYDNAADNNASPRKGLLSKEEILVFNPITQKTSTAVIQYGYDSFGNLNKLT